MVKPLRYIRCACSNLARVRLNITGAMGPRHLPIRTRRAARIAQFRRLGETMRTHSTFFALILAAFAGFAADLVLEPGWSPVVVRVIEEGSRSPVAGARIETTCRGSRYEADRPTTDANGHATIAVYRTWVGLRVTHNGYTNSTVTLVGTNAVSSFCTNAVIKLRRSAR